ncbi:hypothetical protein HK101_001250 [Irineochytrium annulatum]|nr:hypothetical protein HK101_001250 [Irineochytrium annulatum]
MFPQEADSNRFEYGGGDWSKAESFIEKYAIGMTLQVKFPYRTGGDAQFLVADYKRGWLAGNGDERRKSFMRNHREKVAVGDLYVMAGTYFDSAVTVTARTGESVQQKPTNAWMITYNDKAKQIRSNSGNKRTNGYQIHTVEYVMSNLNSATPPQFFPDECKPTEADPGSWIEAVERRLGNPQAATWYNYKNSFFREEKNAYVDAAGEKKEVEATKVKTNTDSHAVLKEDDLGITQ